VGSAYSAGSSGGTSLSRQQSNTPPSKSQEMDHDFSSLNSNNKIGRTSKPSKVKSWEPYANFYYMVQEFENVATLFGRIIISERTLPENRKTIKPATKSVGGIAGGDKYIHAGILFKFIHEEKHSDIYAKDLNVASKSAGLELKSIAMVAIGANQKYKLNYPLAIIIDFEGWRLLAEALLPINKDETLAYGSMNAGKNIKVDPHAAIEIEKLAHILNLCSHTVMDNNHVPHKVYGPVDMEVHKGADGLLYAIDLARLFPPEAPPQGKHRKGNTEYLYKLLRPELVRINKSALSSDAFTPFSNGSPDAYAHEREILTITEQLHNVQIPCFFKDLNSGK
jgi:hypothetical protein